MKASYEQLPVRQLGATSVAGPPDRREGKDKQLSLISCRKLLPAGCALSDAELEIIRDHLYALADILVEEFVGSHKREEQALDADVLARVGVPVSVLRIPV